MKDRTVSELKREASNIKREIDELDRAAHGMTFDELIRIMGGRDEPKSGESDQDTVYPAR